MTDKEAFPRGPALLSKDELKFMTDLDALGCPLWWDTARTRGTGEFYRHRWPHAGHGNNPMMCLEQFEVGPIPFLADLFEPGWCLCANTGDAVVVLDVNVGYADIDAVRESLEESGTRAFAEVITPGGGHHLYLAGGSEMPKSVHGGLGSMRLLSHKKYVYLPGTKLPKYRRKGYTIVFNDLGTLRSMDDYGGAEAFTAWTARQKASGRQRARAMVGRHAAEPSSAGLPDQGGDRSGGGADG
jgi:hypothetical protein